MIRVHVSGYEIGVNGQQVISVKSVSGRALMTLRDDEIINADESADKVIRALQEEAIAASHDLAVFETRIAALEQRIGWFEQDAQRKQRQLHDLAGLSHPTIYDVMEALR